MIILKTGRVAVLRSKISTPLKENRPLQDSCSSSNSINSEKSLPLKENVVTSIEERCKKQRY